MEARNSRRGRMLGFLATTLVFAVLLGAGAMAFSSQHARSLMHAVLTNPVSASSPDVMPLTGSFAPIIKPALPAVVNISTSKMSKPSQNGGGFFNDPFFRQFFGDQFGQQMQPKPEVEHSLGSGVIVSSDGYILTNNHVVDGAEDIKVQLGEKTEYTAKLIGRDPRTDVAVLKIQATNLPTLPLGSSSKLEVGDLVFAIGDPFGVGETVTMGIVSAKGRGSLGIEGPKGYEDFIQTDASINPGNSGGALINSRGECVGINTAIISSGGGNQGIGFAIPIDMAKHIMDQLMKNGKVVRGYLGVTIQNLTPELAKQFGLSQGGGALVGDVTPDSPGAKAGIQKGDAIMQLNDQPVADVSDLRNQISQSAPGTSVTLKIFRDGTASDVTVKLGELPEEAASGTSSEASGGALEGVEVETLTPEIAQRLGLTGPMRGVVVGSVSGTSPAAEAGLAHGDVIQEVNRRPVTNAQEFNSAVSSAGKNSVLLLVNRGGTTSYLVIQPR
jgi:serine protease Do